jgi:hypothetical protein
VTITGTNFTAATAVDFGTNPAAAYTVDSATSITATTPPGAAGPFDTTVSTAGGTSAVGPGDQFTYVAPPTVTNVNPGSGPAAGGTVVALTGTGFTGATAVDFGANAATSFTVDSDVQITATTPAGANGTVPVSVTVPVGGTSTTDGSFTYFTASLSLTKTTTSTGYGAAGQNIPYNYLVTNTGTVTLTGVGVSDNLNPVSCPSGTLATGAHETCTGSYSVTQTDVDNGSVTNTAMAIATGPEMVTSNSSTVTVSAICNPPTITSASSATAVAGTHFTFTVTTCNNAVPVIKATGLPGLITLVNNLNGTATVSGTTTGRYAGVHAVVFTATVRYEVVAVQHFTLTVDSAPIFKSVAHDLVHTGTAFSYAVTTVYGFPVPTITTASTLPSGVHLTDNGNGTATLAGTPGATSGGVYVLTIAATNGIGPPVNQTFTLTVYQAPVITSSNSDTIATGVAMTPFTLTDTGYPVPKLTALGLPYGLKLMDNHNGTGAIIGKTNMTGTFSVTITATGKSGTTSQGFSLTVTP